MKFKETGNVMILSLIEILQLCMANEKSIGRCRATVYQEETCFGMNFQHPARRSRKRQSTLAFLSEISENENERAYQFSKGENRPKDGATRLTDANDRSGGDGTVYTHTHTQPPADRDVRNGRVRTPYAQAGEAGRPPDQPQLAADCSSRCIHSTRLVGLSALLAAFSYCKGSFQTFRTFFSPCVSRYLVCFAKTSRCLFVCKNNRVEWFVSNVTIRFALNASRRWVSSNWTLDFRTLYSRRLLYSAFQWIGRDWSP